MCFPRTGAMRRVQKYLVAAILTLFLLPGLVVVVNYAVGWVWVGLFEPSTYDHRPHPSLSIWQSKLRGVFVSEVKLEPHQLRWHGEAIEIGDAWLEEAAVVDYAPPRPHSRKLGWYYLCFSLRSGEEVFTGIDHP